MKTSKKSLQIYLLVCSFSALIVILFAFIQYSFFLGDTFNVSNYIIPILVGLIFGLLISRNIILRSKLQEEKNIVLEKNKRIRSFTGTIVDDLKNPVSAIHGLSGITLERGNGLDDKAK